MDTLTATVNAIFAAAVVAILGWIVRGGFRDVHRRIDDLERRFTDRFEQVDRRFEQVDKRFEQVDKRFEQVDRRFEVVEERLNQIRSDISALAFRLVGPPRAEGEP
ncbi:MAG TPA: hypothetical protein VF097_02595 [Actinomycetota bacterium]